MSEIHNPTLESAMAVLMGGTDLVDRTLAQPLAQLLAGVADLHEPHETSHGSDVPTSGCQWCNDEDWPCGDMRNAMNLARAILGEPDAEALVDAQGAPHFGCCPDHDWRGPGRDTSDEACADLDEHEAEMHDKETNRG